MPLKLKRGSASQLDNYVLEEGEIAFAIDTKQLYVGISGTAPAKFTEGGGTGGTGGGTYTLPIAGTGSGGTLGGVKVDGSSITINSSGVISATGGGGTGGYTLPTASSSTLGGIKVGSGLQIAVDGTLSTSGTGGGTYTLPIATTSTLGGVKQGTGVTINSSTGVLSIAAATSSTLGGVKQGTGVTIASDGTISVSGGGLTSGTASLYLSDPNGTITPISHPTGALLPSPTTTSSSCLLGKNDAASGIGLYGYAMADLNTSGVIGTGHGNGVVGIALNTSNGIAADMTNWPWIVGVTGVGAQHGGHFSGSAYGVIGYGLSGAFAGMESSVPNSSSLIFQGRNRSGSPTQMVFKVTGGGVVSAVQTTISAADFAEYFEWEDGNPNNEDRVGMCVVISDNSKIRLFNETTDSTNDIFGVVSGTGAVIGNDAPFHWNKTYLTDDFGRTITQKVTKYSWLNTLIPTTEKSEIEISVTVEEAAARGITIPANATVTEVEMPVVNPAYDPNADYTPRSQRKEWTVVGLLGQVWIKKGQPIKPDWRSLKKSNSSADLYLIK